LALAGSPEGAVFAPVGSEYTNLTTGQRFHKRSGFGATGWALAYTAADAATSATANTLALRDGSADLTANNFKTAGGMFQSSGVTYLDSLGSDIRFTFNGGAGQLRILPTDITSFIATIGWYHTVVAPKLVHHTPGSDVPTSELLILSQTPYSGATGANRTPGRLRLMVPSPVSGGAPAECVIDVDGNLVLRCGSNAIGFYGSAPAAQPTVTGAKGGNAALASLLSALAGLGLIVDSTT
jgi:hypothetical protein